MTLKESHLLLHIYTGRGKHMGLSTLSTLSTLLWSHFTLLPRSCQMIHWLLSLLPTFSSSLPIPLTVINLTGNYGSSLMEVFKNLAQDEGICIANTETVFNNAEDDIFDSILDTLLKYKQTARVVACFCEGMTVRGLLKAIRRHRLEGRGDVTGELIFVGRLVENISPFLFCVILLFFPLISLGSFKIDSFCPKSSESVRNGGQISFALHHF